jgi:hypothetical protein
MDDRAQDSPDLTNVQSSLDRGRRKVSASIGGHQRYRMFHLYPTRPQAPTTSRARITSPLCCCCQVAGRVFFVVGSCGEGASAVVRGHMVVSGPGVAGPKSWRSGCELAALESESFPGCPPGPLVLAAAAWRASAWRRAKMASLILRLRDLSASLWVFRRPPSCRSRRGPRCACAGAGLSRPCGWRG